ncbi:hypothetical protein SAMN05216327_12046 [Dyadobacter sp. SG02]|uniref:hypothetical protein n=1 Tax=Dyadobacter sp. SG02 TaxID=1855291 RepID=UPI0008C00332|nr:hypothetical protein [Dyadobacter sp. SG02]SEJ79323.1 hypothetical protein SAMN05216327_12046 [Dyadobacter sp. SG02]
MKITFKDFLGTFILPIKTASKLLEVSFKQLPLRTVIGDFFSVASSIGFVAIPAFLAGLIFILLEQGRDTLLLVVEKMIVLDLWPLICLLVSLVIYSGFAELGVRYAIYISDNSGRNLTDERVFFRKTSQKLLAALFLLWPFLITMVGLVICYFRATYLSDLQRNVSFGICFALIYWLMAAMTSLYFDKFGKSAPGNAQDTRLGERSLSKKERFWLGKLYGIYDDYIYTLPKPSTFISTPFKTPIISFTDLFKSTPTVNETFLQDPLIIKKDRKIPDEFQLVGNNVSSGKKELFKWVYRIPTSFYKTLHFQIIGMASCSSIILVAIALPEAGSGIYQKIGAPALVCLAFGCYCGLYAGLLFLDKALLRSSPISVRLLIAIVVIVFSVFNHDHPVRITQEQLPKRPTVARQFDRWFKSYVNRIDSTNAPRTDPNKKYPVFFICAEGGALRTGAYTGLYLTKLEEIMSDSLGIDLRGSIFAMSGVSGGAVGLGVYNAIAYRQKDIQQDNATRLATSFFSHDALSPLIGKMFFGEFLNLFWPRNIDRFSRATALEKSWEQAYGEFSGPSHNVFSSNFIENNPDSLSPLLIFNTSEVESGFQCWVSNLEPDIMLFKDKRDLFLRKIRQVRYSTAINFSSRFPLFSPGAAIRADSGKAKLHYVDGGYVENKGTASMLEVFQILKAKSSNFKNVVPVMIYLQFSDEASAPVNDINFANELTEIIYGIYNTRSGRTSTSEQLLKNAVADHNRGLNVDQPLRSKSVPMNWVLSSQSIENINRDINEKLTDTTSKGIIAVVREVKTRYPKNG